MPRSDTAGGLVRREAWHLATRDAAGQRRGALAKARKPPLMQGSWPHPFTAPERAGAGRGALLESGSTVTPPPGSRTQAAVRHLDVKKKKKTIFDCAADV